MDEILISYLTRGMSHRKVTVLELLAVVASCAAAAGCIRSDLYVRVILVAIVIIGLVGAGFFIYIKGRELKA